METITSKIKFRVFEYKNCDSDSPSDYGLMFNLIYQDPKHRPNIEFRAEDGFRISTRYYLSGSSETSRFYLNKEKQMLKEENVSLTFNTVSSRTSYKNRLIQALKEWAK